ncbi:hypothetical protein [Erythrobacter sp. QSSC1-22B]|uniref:hypothetical protein n=1 Tax=Erythrobacter sp. QSSC1-22B TaxID=1860125 RepID=UPI000AF70543|nr:hypothetical protein [Erythrobacter sp. QSSC1-22B]
MHRLAQAGIATFLLISAFDIHRWRVDEWQAFDTAFEALAAQIFGQPVRPVWLYALAFPVVAVNFGCMVQMVRGRRDGLLLPFAISAIVIAVVPLFAGQMIVYRMIWEQMLTMLGYAISGAIATILALRLDGRGLDSTPADAKDAGNNRED